jgi:photosystem II stability/assembly factor-like uncharacterized protein
MIRVEARGEDQRNEERQAFVQSYGSATLDASNLIMPLVFFLYLVAFGGGVYRSVDGGRRWGAASRGLDDLAVLTLVMDPTSPRVLYAGTDSGVFVSRDGGQTWARPRPVMPDRNIRSLVVVPTRPTVLYAATDRGVLWSVNGGADWARRGARR